MKGLLADENVIPAHCSALESAGYDIRRSEDVLEKGASDEAVLSTATELDRVLITYDRKDFADVAGHGGVCIATEDMRPRDLRNAVDRIERAYPDLADVIEYLSDWV